jgi:hypothetical protein
MLSFTPNSRALGGALSAQAPEPQAEASHSTVPLYSARAGEVWRLVVLLLTFIVTRPLPAAVSRAALPLVSAALTSLTNS